MTHNDHNRNPYDAEARTSTSDGPWAARVVVGARMATGSFIGDPATGRRTPISEWGMLAAGAVRLYNPDRRTQCDTSPMATSVAFCDQPAAIWDMHPSVAPSSGGGTQGCASSLRGDS
jgi:hypothetical protein